MSEVHSEAMDVDFEKIGGLIKIESDADERVPTLIKAFVEDSKKSLKILKSISKDIDEKVMEVTDSLVAAFLPKPHLIEVGIEMLESLIGLLLIRLHHSICILKKNIKWFSDESNWKGCLEYGSWQSLFDASQRMRQSLMINALEFKYSGLENARLQVLRSIK